MENMQPNDVASEKALLGCILTKNETLETALEFVTKNDFYNQRNKAIFEVMEFMYSNNQVIEPLSLFKKCNDQFEVYEEYILEIYQDAPSSENVEFYANRIVNSATKRQAVELLQQAQHEIITSDEPSGKVAELMGRMENIRSASVDNSVFTIQDLFAMRADFLYKNQN